MVIVEAVGGREVPSLSSLCSLAPWRTSLSVAAPSLRTPFLIAPVGNGEGEAAVHMVAMVRSSHGYAEADTVRQTGSGDGDSGHQAVQCRAVR